MEGNKNNKSNWLEWVIIIIHKTNLKSNNKIIIKMMSNKNIRNKIKTHILQKLLKLTKNSNNIHNNNNNKWNNNNLIAKMVFVNGCNNTMNNLKVI